MIGLAMPLGVVQSGEPTLTVTEEEDNASARALGLTSGTASASHGKTSLAATACICARPFSTGPGYPPTTLSASMPMFEDLTPLAVSLTVSEFASTRTTTVVPARASAAPERHHRPD